MPDSTSSSSAVLPSPGLDGETVSREENRKFSFFASSVLLAFVAAVKSGEQRREKSFLLLLREIQFDCNMFRFRCEGRRRKARDGRVFHQQKSSCTWFRISLWRELIGEFVTWKNSNRIVPERDSLWLQFVSNQRGELLRAKHQSFHSMFACFITNSHDRDC